MGKVMWAWVVKFLGGFIPFLTKPFGEWLGKILWVVAIIIIFNVAMNKLFPPKPNTINVAGNYIAEGKGDVAHFGCSLWRGYIKTGITK
jgi:hypothetical protein